MNWYKKLVLVSVILTLCVVVFGAYVRLTDAGLGCPDWPGCYGTLTVPESIESIENAQQAFPDSPVETDKAWIEMIHRYLAGMLGIVIFTIAFFSYKNRDEIKVPLILPFFLVGLLFFQAALGMWTVTMLLKPAIVSLHLIGGMSILGILTFIAHRHWGSVSNTAVLGKSIVLFTRFALVLLFIQILLGGWTSTNYAALACTDYPTCHGSLIPAMDFKNSFSIFRELGMTPDGQQLSLEALHAIQWVHRIGAIVLTLYLIGLAVFLAAYPGIRFYKNLLLIVLAFQFIIGIANLLLHLPIILATAHNLGAAFLVIILVIINSRITPNHD
ncbi:MAG: COX15/CtaA family protein [Nitrosomonadales bacterium]|nr:COX15/CtaA family protein [Nitrosomonadales bacterium]